MADTPQKRTGIRAREIGFIILVLVVLAISLIAWMQSKRGESSAVVSARNLQQWGIALNLHLIENDNELPAVGGEPISADQTAAWYNALPTYLGLQPLAEMEPGSRPHPGQSSLWIDPATKEPRVWDPTVFYFNYGMNRFLQPDPDLRPFKIYEIDYPGNVVFLTEIDGYAPVVTPDTVVFRRDPSATNATAHVLFCDGHVAPVTRDTLVDNPTSREAAAAENGPSWFEK
ncbi:MAG: hypothetical protein WA771_15980 [Chthoniobacterales bacterium]